MVLALQDLDRKASHRRLPNVTNDDGYGDQADAYAELEADVPIRIEQKEIETDQRAASDVISWTGFVLPTIANAPRINDRFVIGTTVYSVDSVEQLTQLDGTVDHYDMDLTEIHVG